MAAAYVVYDRKRNLYYNRWLKGWVNVLGHASWVDRHEANADAKATGCILLAVSADGHLREVQEPR